jgi:hypothetical protein
VLSNRLASVAAAERRRSLRKIPDSFPLTDTAYRRAECSRGCRATVFRRQPGKNILESTLAGSPPLELHVWIVGCEVRHGVHQWNVVEIC